jgi:hypothetical protein
MSYQSTIAITPQASLKEPVLEGFDQRHRAVQHHLIHGGAAKARSASGCDNMPEQLSTA